MTSSQDIINHFSPIFDEYSDPQIASGQCYLMSAKVLDKYPNIETAYAQHHNDPDGRFYDQGQYSNHFATWLPEENLIVDFTLRQFAPRSAWPWTGSYSAWLKILARAWGVPSVKHLTRTRGQLCTACANVNCDPDFCGEEEEY